MILDIIEKVFSKQVDIFGEIIGFFTIIATVMIPFGLLLVTIGNYG